MILPDTEILNYIDARKIKNSMRHHLGFDLDGFQRKKCNGRANLECAINSALKSVLWEKYTGKLVDVRGCNVGDIQKGEYLSGIESKTPSHPDTESWALDVT